MKTKKLHSYSKYLSHFQSHISLYKIPVKKLTVVVFFISQCVFLQAQETSEKDSIFDPSSKSFVAVPLITSSPVMKTGFGGMAMYFFNVTKKDTISPPSLLSLYTIYSTNKSYIVAPFGRFFWNEDRNRAAVAVGTFRMNNDFNYNEQGNDLRLVFSEIRNFVTLEYSRKVVNDFYLGVLYLGTKTSYKFDQGTDEENDFTREFFEENEIEDNFVSSLGFNFSFDNSDYVYYPTKGLTFSVRPKLNAGWLGSENDYVDIDYKFSYYYPVKDNKILAFNLSGGFAFGDVPFDGYQNYGVRNSLRGYDAGKYKGKHMVAFQAEYRWQFYKKWGAVAFGGTGSVWGNDNDGEEEFNRNMLPSGGLGLRFMISKAKRINLRLDYAIGVDGNQGIYFGVMEAF